MLERREIDLNAQELETHEGIAIVDLYGGCVNLADAGFLEFTQYEFDEVHGMSLRELFTSAGEIIDPIVEGMKGWKGEQDLRTKGGAIIPVNLSIVPARDEEYECVAFMMRISRV